MTFLDIVVILGNLVVQSIMYTYLNSSFGASIFGFAVGIVVWFAWLRP